MGKYAKGVRASDLSLVEMANPATDSPAAAGDFAPPVGAADGSPAIDRFLAEAEREFQEGYIDQPLWARAVVKAAGDEKLAAQSYVRFRAAALRVEKRNQRAVRLARRARAMSVANGTLSKPSSPKYGITGLTRKQLAWLTGTLSFLIVAAGLIAFRSGSEAPQRTNAAGPVRSASEAASATPAKATSTDASEATIPRRDYAARVRELNEAGNWNVVVLYAAEWTRSQPNNPDAWKELSGGYLKLRQFSDAVEAATRAVEIAPKDAAMWRNLGQVNAAMDDAPAAIAAYEKAVEADPQDAASLVQVGVLNMQIGALSAAKVALAKALALAPGDADALCAAAFLAQREGRPRDAEATFLQVTSSGGKCRAPNAGETASVAPPKPAKAKPSSATGR
ncbi:MAG TPA: tetratricopeptide repeat protein [Casimicrobiaceae bacterium]|nr:tetratricopeptide repeat protein [Casimicrobiaceae bacterium]